MIDDDNTWWSWWIYEEKSEDQLTIMMKKERRWRHGWSCKVNEEWRWAEREVDRGGVGWMVLQLAGRSVLTWGSGRGAQWAARTIVPISGAGYCRHEVRFPAVYASEHKVLLWCVNDIFCNCGFGFCLVCFGFVSYSFYLFFLLCSLIKIVCLNLASK